VSGESPESIAGPPAHPGEGSPPELLAGIDLAIFDKDGTLIDFHLMWTGWVRELADRMSDANDGRRLDQLIHEVMGVDPETGRVLPHGALAATPMTRLREMLVDAVAGTGRSVADAERIVDAGWHAPDPVVLAHPLTDLAVLFAGLRAAGVRIAVATSDDRVPTERTLAHLGVERLVEALSCADDGRPVKPSPDAVHWICRALGVPEARTAVIGDSAADMAMGRRARAGRVIGVLTGVGDRATLADAADIVLESVAALLPAT
jgi:phosphoglycolate phosphatase